MAQMVKEMPVNHEQLSSSPKGLVKILSFIFISRGKWWRQKHSWSSMASHGHIGLSASVRDFDSKLKQRAIEEDKRHCIWLPQECVYMYTHIFMHTSTHRYI